MFRALILTISGLELRTFSAENYIDALDEMLDFVEGDESRILRIERSVRKIK